MRAGVFFSGRDAFFLGSLILVTRAFPFRTRRVVFTRLAASSAEGLCDRNSAVSRRWPRDVSSGEARFFCFFSAWLRWYRRLGQLFFL